MKKSDQALQVFNSGFNCSQAVFSVFCEELQFDKDTALKLACGFGGGMRQGEVCGAVSGAIIALSLKHGQYKEEDIASKEKTYSLVSTFNQRFKEMHGSIICKELLGCDISQPGVRAKANEQGLFDSVCPIMIQSAVELLEDIF